MFVDFVDSANPVDSAGPSADRSGGCFADETDGLVAVARVASTQNFQRSPRSVPTSRLSSWDH